MRPDLANRIVFVLACAGAYVALVLALSHQAGASLPCGASEGPSGCDKVQMDDWSKLAGVPVAFFGVGLYLVVALCAFCRDVIGPAASPRLGAAMWVALAVGTIGSAVLLNHAYFDLHANCMWCTASGIIMGAAFLTHSLGQLKAPPPATARWPVAAFAAVFLIGVGGGVGYGAYIASTAKGALAPKEVSVPETVPLVHPDTPIRGEEPAQILVVEFSDLHCPTCKRTHLWLKGELNGRLKGRVKTAFRHFPLIRTHPNALTAALIAEWARSYGKFWEFIDIQFENQDLTEPAQMMTLVSAIELDQDEAQATIMSKKRQRKMLELVQRDIADAFKLGVSSTPTWFVQYPNGKVLSSTGDGIVQLLSEAEIERHSAR